MMNAKIDSFDEILATLTQLRQQTKPPHRFPQELWDAIISLTRTHSVQHVSKRLNISLSYLKRKIQASASVSSVDFIEIPIQNACSDMVSIELFSDFGVRAKIQGPPSCLGYLSTLFGR